MPHIVLLYADAGVSQQGLHNGQMTLCSRPVKRGAAALRGKSDGYRVLQQQRRSSRKFSKGADLPCPSLPR